MAHFIGLSFFLRYDHSMKALILTKEYPPHIYGGAGVHVGNLSKALSKLCQVDVRYFGPDSATKENLTITGFPVKSKHYTAPDQLHSVFDAVQRSLDHNTLRIDADVVHVHTWYAHFGGILAKLTYGIPLVVTVHSLEPLRPWKRDQLGGGYDFTCWIEKTVLDLADAVVAVSEETKRDIIRLFPINPHKVHVIHNGVDLDEFKPTHAPELLRPYGIDPDKPYVLFVGRITRQKGILHMLNAIDRMDPNYQVVLCTGNADTKEIEGQVTARIQQIQAHRQGVTWIRNLNDTPTMVALYSHAAVFCCTSIYEPFGIINLEAMACEIPVVASKVGGIKEIVVHGETGVLIPLDPDDSTRFEEQIVVEVTQLMNDEPLRKKLGKAGRERALNHFSWRAIAQKTYDLYHWLSAKP